MGDDTINCDKVEVGIYCGDDLINKLVRGKIVCKSCLDSELESQCSDNDTRFFALLRLLDYLVVSNATIEPVFRDGINIQ